MTKVKFKTIVKIANEIKKHVEKNHVLPGKVTVDKVDYTYPVACYLIAKAAQNPGKDVTTMKVGKAPNKTGQTVEFTISLSDYKKLAKNLTAFIENNKKLPNYLTYTNKKIKQRVFIYSFAKIIVWYNNHKNTLPQTCRFFTSETVAKSKSSSAKKSKHGHATVHGCDNMGQNNSVNCGPHSMQEVIRNLTGKVIKQSTLAGWAGTGSGGTDHHGLETAIAKAGKQLGVKFTVKWYNFSDLGWNGINKILKSNNQDCIIHNLYRNKWGHYEVVNAISGSNIKVQNSLGDSCSSGCYCGYVENRTSGEFKSYINGISQKSVMVITMEG